MKFLCSILILAGVFALNDAFPSSDDHMRLAYDEMIMKDVKLMLANRDAASSVQCSQEYLNEMTNCLGNYNNLLKGCEDAAENTINELNKNAIEKMNEFKSSISTTCSEICSSESEEIEPSDELDCIEQLSLKNSRNLSDISVEASSFKVVLLKAIDDTEGIKDVCTQKSYSEYVTESQKIEDKFKKCVQTREA